MTDATLQAALEREHRDIDGGIETYLAGLSAGDGGGDGTAPLMRALDALRRHIYLEEAFLFPPLREAGMAMPIFVMQREHGQLWRLMDRLGTLVADGACDTVGLGDTCRELLAELEHHNDKEEPIIYTVADSTLSADAAARLTRFIADGNTPDGWVCAEG